MAASNRARLRWLPKAILALAALYFALIALWLFFSNFVQPANPTGNDWFLIAASIICCAVLAILLALSLRLPSPTRSNIALLVAVSGAAILLVEVLLRLQDDTGRGFRAKTLVSFAQAAGRPIGEIRFWAFIRDLRRNNTDVFPFLGPPSNQAYISQPDGPQLITLAGISEVTTVGCNESGQFETYFSDEHGFNNPLGLHDLAPLDVVLAGDSFMHNICVPRADSVAGRIRTSIPRTLNLGISGAGPLTSLAALIEYASMARPRIVVWGFYEGNDIKDAMVEALKPELRRYLTARAPFGLRAMQEEIDFALRAKTANIVLISRAKEIGHLLMLRATRSRLGIISHPNAPRSGFAPTEAALSAARDLVHNWGGQLVVVYQPSAERYCGSVESWHNECNEHRHYMPRTLGVRDKALDLFERLGVPVVDGHAAFLETGRPGDMFFHPYSHYSPEGYRVIADAVLREIRPMLDQHPDRSAAAATPPARSHP